jgi:hypothetical protein
MNTIRAGRLFVEKYNEEEGKKMTPRDILCMLAEKAFKDNKFMVWWGNSKFHEYYKKYRKYENGDEKPDFNETLYSFCDTLENFNVGVETSSNVYGGCAFPIDKDGCGPTTEFNFCDNIHLSLDDRYYSFIGAFFLIKVEGKSTTINNKDLLWILYDGFNKYYKFIRDNECMNTKQLDRWNGQYLYHRIKNGKKKFDAEPIIAGNDILEITYIEFLDMITRIDGNKVKYALFERFDKVNTTAGYVTFDLDGIRGKFSILKKILKDVDENFDIREYEKSFAKTGLMRKSLEFGEVTADMIDPLYDLRNDANRADILSRNNAAAVKNLKKYLEIAIMKKEEIDLSKRFVEFIENSRKKSKLSVKSELDAVLKPRDLTSFGNALITFCEKAGVKANDGTPMEVVDYFAQDENKKILKEFLMYTRFKLNNN